MSNEYLDYKLNEICRGCLTEEGNMISIFHTNENLNITQMFENCTSLQISENDGYPSKICNKCMVRLNESYQFKQMCLRSEHTIRSLKVSSDDLKVETDEEDVEVFISSEKAVDEEDNVVYGSAIIEVENIQMEGENEEEEEDELDQYDNENRCHSNDDIEVKLGNSDIGSDNLNNDVDNKHHKKNYYDCSSCLEKFETFRDLKQHEFDWHMPGKMCTICSKTFISVDEVMNHARKHLRKPRDMLRKASTTTKKYKCDYCDKEYTSANNLQIHMYSHSGVKPFTCKECGKSFTKINALNSHVSLHTGYLSFLCSECGKGYSTATGLKRHKISHTGEKPYKCKICPGSFSASGDLTVHMRCHTGEKPYLCPTCGKAFSRISHLHTHARIHTGEKPYKCSRCDKAFAQSGDLKSHERIHTGEKPYECAICKKRFIQSSGLTSHMKTHTGEKSYKCNVCDKAFSQASSLARHIRCHEY